VSALTKAARGRDCLVRSPVCSHNNEETVLAHVRMQGVSGMGIKAPDLLGAWACYPCHMLCDTGQWQDTRMERDERDLLLLQGMVRTQTVLLREGRIKV
jgi:hypothetical protein